MPEGISVVIPTYNGTRYIGEALLSVLAQTRFPKEIIVVDDHSVDNTAEVVAGVARACAVRVRFIALSRNSGGPGRPLNVGIASAQGDFIAVLEQDDVMLPRRLQRQVEALLTYPECSVAIGGYEVCGCKREELQWSLRDPQFQHVECDACDVRSLAHNASFVIPSEVAFRALLKRNFAISNSNLCFRKRIWEATGGFSEVFHAVSDLDFLLRATKQGPIAVVNETLLRYRWRSDSLNRRCSDGVVQHILVLIDSIAADPTWLGDLFWPSYLKFRNHCRLQLQQGNLRNGLRLACGLLRLRLAHKLAQFRESPATSSVGGRT